MSNLSPGDLVEVVDGPPPPGYERWRWETSRLKIGDRGVVLSHEYAKLSELPSQLFIPAHDVRFAAWGGPVASACLRKINGPPLDDVFDDHEELIFEGSKPWSERA